MKNNYIELFVPGRLCLVGEHSDWAGKYRSQNNNIEKGYAIVTGINEGIYAKVKTSDKLIVKNNVNHTSFTCDMDYDKLKKVANEGGYYSYIAGVAATIIEQYNVSGIEVIITKSTLPEKKGLSSSAAICVLIARAFNKLYHLHLNTIGEMNLAYLGEITTPSRCGRLDQACAYGTKPILMIFDGEKIEIKRIKVKSGLYYVFADLNSHKDTIKILADLNRSYPYPETDIDLSVHKGLGEKNKEIVLKTIKYIEEGDLENLGKMLTKAQNNFDKNVSIACKDELSSPILHSVLNDDYIKELSYGSKGVGSQGDGMIQILAKDYESQQKIKKYLDKKLHMTAYSLTIEPTKEVRKAIIPVAGNGTRLFPVTRCTNKSFLPVMDNGILKPVILCLIEEIVDAGIEEVCLIIDKESQKDYDRLFKQKLPEEIISKLSSEMLNYESKIRDIGKKIKYVYQEEKLGLGHAVSLCSDFANDEPVLLVLGDQLYKSFDNKSCTEQFLDNYTDPKKLAISVCEVKLQDVYKYGILCGKVDKDSNSFDVIKMVEKPQPDICEEKYYTKVNKDKKYYAVFGEYILTSDVFELLKRDVKKKVMHGGEIQLTNVLDEIREKSGMVAFIPKGEMYDMGNTKGYMETFINKAK